MDYCIADLWDLGNADYILLVHDFTHVQLVLNHGAQLIRVCLCAYFCKRVAPLLRHGAREAEVGPSQDTENICGVAVFFILHFGFFISN